ncbi:hypothetical protein A3D03_04220 [Candidatus Gottesmanbacteria bacterium RIFCSPHIGHO2_02_FULL_40_13]|uniref:Polymerase beta nucleotidyltransferase domain-containing protein n=1 Tax=Candidatus Gottesmanbacteria bacterium RIFCSPHIGHO2_02_FULL_40_13 TaxID=1798384 RepID=A0A1F6A8S1_9BACT|nr:MAG: hypothetical protein A3D03_04220 [Candidatus Gottesmanbacteria bacterium RIFCSPHIGHO2_02_FULL_40_13]
MQHKVNLPHYSEICELFRQYGVSYAGLFGSRAHGDNSPDSDFDILVDFEPNSKTTFLGMIDLKQKLEDVVMNKVDIVTRRSLSPHMRENILQSVIPIYGQKS